MPVEPQDDLRLTSEPPDPEMPDPKLRRCERAGCTAEGRFRAPVSRDHLNHYYWFCLDHVREYNAAWDFFAGLSSEEIEQQRRRDATWQRPSWPFAGRKAGGRANGEIHDPYGFFDDEGTARPQSPPQSKRAQALALLNLDNDASFVSVKARYKELVKQLHPDANGGDPEAEERMKVINQAYATLKAEFS